MHNKITEVFEELKQEMMETHIAVHPGKNPIAVDIHKLSSDQLQYVVAQYSLFPQKIVDLLYAAREAARKNEWSEVDAELTRNMGEELGTETGGSSHYEVLIHGIADAIDSSLYDTLKKLEAAPATKNFLSRIAMAMRNENIAYVIGATYALESSAVPELIIVKDILTQLLQKTTGQPMEGVLKGFFDNHLGTWEPGHEQGLHASVPKYLSVDDLDFFHTGFTTVMTAMDIWWIDLKNETDAISE